MPAENDLEPKEPLPPVVEKIQKTTNQFTLATELPFTLVGAVVVGGLIGYYLDKWLHTTPWMLVLFGGFGFVAGILEIARRFGPGK